MCIQKATGAPVTDNSASHQAQLQGRGGTLVVLYLFGPQSYMEDVNMIASYSLCFYYTHLHALSKDGLAEREE